jgi:hypothetical protein
VAIRFQYRDGGIEYTFDAAGEGLPMHLHRVVDQHDTTVLQGSVLVYGPRGVRLQRGKAGDTVTFDALDAHEVMALEPGTKIFNRYLLGYPPAIASLSEAERSGAVEADISHYLNEAGLPVLKDT